MTDYPFREYLKDELYSEFKKLQDYESQYNIREDHIILSKKNIGYKCSNVFFQYERMNTPTWSHQTNLEFWKTHREKIMKYYLQQDKMRDLFGVIQFMNHPPSQFPPNIAIDIYTLCDAQTIFDPFAGWGDRCIAAMAKGLDYIGVDCNTNLYDAYYNLKLFYPTSSKITFINKPIEKVNIASLDFDIVLTSPPFWTDKNKLVDHYNNQSIKDYEGFMDTVLIPTIITCRKKAKFSFYYIPDNMASYLYDKNIKWDDILGFSKMGNNKYQNYKLYCFHLQNLD